MYTPVRLECFAEIPKRPEMVVISGASGSGKGTIVKKVMEFTDTAGEQKYLSRSWTTREQRPGESDDAYHFVTREEFEDNILSSGFLEYTEYDGNYYGTPRPKSDTGQLIVEIETNGAGQLRELAHAHDVYTQFQYVLAASPAQLESQLFGRDDDIGPEEKMRRLSIFYKKELDQARRLGAHVIVNTDPDLAALKAYAASNGVFFCDPKLSDVIQMYEEARVSYVTPSNDTAS